MTDAPPEPSRDASRYSVLTISPDAEVRRTVAALFSGSGTTVLEAENSEKGLDLSRNNEPALILLDLHLDDGHALATLKTFVTLCPDTPIIVLTGPDTGSDAAQALQAGAWDVAPPPVEAFGATLLQHAADRARERVELLRLSREYQARLTREVDQRTEYLQDRLRQREKSFLSLITKGKNGVTTLDDETSLLEHRFLQTIIDGVLEPAQLIDLDKKVLLFNQAARDLLPPELLEHPTLTCHQTVPYFNASCTADDEESCPLERVKASGQTVSLIRDGNGQGVCEIKASPLWNENGSMSGCLLIFRNMDADQEDEKRLRDHESRLYYLAHHDPLTDLPNRMLFQDRLQMLMAKAHRHQHQVAVLLLDLDRFKKINETLGHEAGDKVLQEIAVRLQNCLRRSDTVARLSGDEFGIILDDIQDPKYVTVVTRKIMEALGLPFRIEDFELFVSTSIGISLFPEDSTNSERLMQCADTAMNRAKEQGRNNYQFYTADMNTRAVEFLLMENGLRKALDQEELVLYYQPQFDTASNRLVGAEALVRWQHPRKGLVEPGDFIPLAEETGLIEPLGEWVMRTACAQNRAWQDQGLPPITVAVNLSARQFRQPNFHTMVSGILADTGLDSGSLELELTESVIVQNVEKNIELLNTLSGMGIKIAIDDFGTGYSSLSYLRLFPITRLKIDRSFIEQIHTNPSDAVIVSSIIALAQNMNIQVIAEGVEQEAQLNLLHKQGCFLVQGYLFGKPVPAQEFIHLFNRGARGS